MDNKLDVAKYNEFLAASEFANKAFSGNNIRIDAKFHSPYYNMGTIAVIGDKITVSDYKSFRELCRMSEPCSWEVFTIIEGFTQMTFSIFDKTKVVITED